MASLKAVVFDMDDTLLSLNLSAFVAMYGMDVANLLAQAARKKPLSMFAAYAASMMELNSGERKPSDTRTNFEFFANDFEQRCGIPLAEPAILNMLEFYERDILPRKNGRAIAARPRTGAQEAVEKVLGRGLRIALLTNPCFSQACVECRMGWGNMLHMPFELITTWSNTTRCKPAAQYYRESLDKLGLSPAEVLMVGNDPKRDLPARELGLKTAYVGLGTPNNALWCGSMEDFANNFSEIEERFYSLQ